MVVTALFWLGVIMTAYIGWKSWQASSDTKRGVVAIPFGLLLAAAVAKYIGL